MSGRFGLQSGASRLPLNGPGEPDRVAAERTRIGFRLAGELLGKPARGKTCEAIQGIIAEGDEIMEEYKGTAALDAGLISSAQAVEHYEIARYGTLKSWAAQLGLKDAIPLLDTNLQEEIATDKKLTALGKASANTTASKRKAS